MSDESCGRAVLVVEIEVAEADVDDLNRWYDDKHVPERLAMPGFVSARRFASTEKPGRFLAVYELDGAQAALSDDYMVDGGARSRPSGTVPSMRRGCTCDVRCGPKPRSERAMSEVATRVAVVTGAAQGLGYGIAAALATAGHHVAILTRHRRA